MRAMEKTLKKRVREREREEEKKKREYLEGIEVEEHV